MKKIKTLTLLACTLPMVTMANPGETTKLLIDEKVSIMDFAIYKLNNRVVNLCNTLFKDRKDKPFCSAIYDFDSDMINITLQTREDENKALSDLKLLQGKFMREGEYSSYQNMALDRYFSHSGYTTKKLKDITNKMSKHVQFELVLLRDNFKTCRVRFDKDELYCNIKK